MKDPLIKLDESIIDNGMQPGKVGFQRLMIGNSSLMGNVGPVLLKITLALHLSLDKNPSLSDLALEAFGDIGHTVPQNLEVGLRSCDTLRDCHYIGGNTRRRSRGHMPNG